MGRVILIGLSAEEVTTAMKLLGEAMIKTEVVVVSEPKAPSITIEDLADRMAGSDHDGLTEFLDTREDCDKFILKALPQDIERPLISDEQLHPGDVGYKPRPAKKFGNNRKQSKGRKKRR